MIFANQQLLDGACGINNINGFYEAEKKDQWDYNSFALETFTRRDLDQGGKLLFTSFDKGKLSKKAYHILCNRFEKVYQSPLTVNNFHGPRHQFFFCVFDTSKELKNAG
jgi:hypothetical protein